MPPGGRGWGDEKWARGDAAFIAVSLCAFPGERRVSFPPIAKGGQGGWPRHRQSPGFPRGFLLASPRLLAPLPRTGQPFTMSEASVPTPPGPPFARGGKGSLGRAGFRSRATKTPVSQPPLPSSQHELLITPALSSPMTIRRCRERGSHQTSVTPGAACWST